MDEKKNITLDRQITFVSFVLSTAENLLILELTAPLNALAKQPLENFAEKTLGAAWIPPLLHGVVVLTQIHGVL